MYIVETVVRVPLIKEMFLFQDVVYKGFCYHFFFQQTRNYSNGCSGSCYGKLNQAVPVFLVIQTSANELSDIWSFVMNSINLTNSQGNSVCTVCVFVCVSQV